MVNQKLWRACGRKIVQQCLPSSHYQSGGSGKVSPVHQFAAAEVFSRKGPILLKQCREKQKKRMDLK